MSCNLSSALVRRRHRRRKFRRSNEHIRFKIVYALVEPVVHRLSRVVRPAECVHLDRETAGSFQVRSSNVNLRSRRCASIDLLLELKIRVGLKPTRGADRRHSRGKVQAWEAEPHLSEDAVAHRIEHVVVHSDKTGNDGVTMQVKHLGIFRNIRGCSVGN